MGFFNTILKGLGFEGEEEPKKTKEKKKKEKPVKAGHYSLEEVENNIIEMRPKTQEEVHKTIDLLRKEGKVIVDLSAFGEIDKNLALQFLSGAVYAFNGEIFVTDDGKYKLLVI